MQTTRGQEIETMPARSGVRGWVSSHPLFAFAGLAYAVSWGWWIPLAVAGGEVEAGMGWPTQIPGLMGPLIAAVAVTWLIEGGHGVAALWQRATAWRLGWWWLSVPAILGAGAIGLLTSSEPFNWDEMLAYQGIGAGVGALATIGIVFVCNGLGEEVGWRGFAADRLLQRHTLTVTSMMVAVVWAPWHLPVFFFQESFREFTAVEVVGWVLGLTAGSIVLTWLYRGSKQSILLVAAWHTAFNLTSATTAAAGTAAAVSSTVVMVVAVVVVLLDMRLSRRSLRNGDT